MTWGFEFINNDDVVTVDSEFARLSVISRGRFIPTQESGLGSTTTFERAITSQEPPLVFVKPDTVSAVAGLCLMRILGSPGNWTGFYVRAYDALSAQPRGSYFAAAFQASEVAEWGARLFDETEKTIYDTGTPCVVFTKSYQVWPRIKSGSDSQGYTMVYFSVPFDFTAGDYMLINNFGMDMAGGSDREVALCCWWDFPGNRLWAITTGITNQTTLYLPAVFAKTQA